MILRSDPLTLSSLLRDPPNCLLNAAQLAEFSRSVLSDSLRPHEPQHARPPCPSPTPRVYPNSCPLSWWCHPTISFSVVPFSSCPQSLPASGSFQMSQLFASGGQRIGVSASTSVLPMNAQDWSPLGCCAANDELPTENLPSWKQVFGSHPPHHPGSIYSIILKLSCSYFWHPIGHQFLSICDKNVEKHPFCSYLSPVLIFSMWIATISL